MNSSSKKIKRLTFCFFVFLFAGAFFVSCSTDGSESAFTKQLEKIDSFISTNQYKEASKLLKKTEKKAYSIYTRISVYTRYLKLGDYKECERVLKKARTKFPDNNELTALYAKFLLDNKRVTEALTVSKPLSGTKYGSIYSEALIKSLKDYDTISKGVFNSSLLDDEMSGVYEDIYESTSDSHYLINRACISLFNGDYQQASMLQPDEIKNDKDLLFWALVQFDNRSYDRCTELLSNITQDVLKSRAVSLYSDAYVMVGDVYNAEKVRSDFIASRTFDEVPKRLMVNSALWAFSNEDYKKSYDLLLGVLDSDEMNEPALVSYGKFAWADSIPVQQTLLEQEVRKTSLRTKKMEQYDERPKFILSDAMNRLKVMIDTQKNYNEKNVRVILEYLSLYLRKNESLPLKSKTAMIWKTLEENEIQSDLYPSLLVQFCVDKLLSYGLTDDARMLFTNYMNAKYLLLNQNEAGVEDSVVTDVFGGTRKIHLDVLPQDLVRMAFGNAVAEHVEVMDVWEIETAAFFCLKDGNGTAARRLFEYIVFEPSYINSNRIFDIRFVTPDASDSAVVNLAMIYASTGDVKRALALYGLAAGRTRDFMLKSKVLYVTAYLQHSINEDQKALLSIDYCLALDPSNADARLLRIKIMNK